MSLGDRELRGGAAIQQLHWLAAGQVDGATLLRACAAAIDRDNGALNAFLALAPDAAQQAAASDARRAQHTIGRLDGLVVAVKDNLDVAGLPTSAGLPARRQRVAASDASAVARLRAAGAVIIGKTNLDEGVLGTSSRNPHCGAVHNPWRHEFSAGGSSGGSAAAVAAGQCSFALGSDTLGSVRIPASHCGIFALKPTHGEISTRGLLPAARRLDCVGILARAAEDLAVVLQVLAGHDPADPRSRRRRVPLATPDWQPGHLRSAFVRDLRALGVSDAVHDVFERALAQLAAPLGERVAVDFADFDITRTRRAALLIMEAELAAEYAADLADTAQPVSAQLRALLDYPTRKSALDYVAADRLLDATILKAREVFAGIDVLVLPTVPQGPQPLAAAERANDADLTCFASLAGCPAVSLPMGTLPDGMPIGLQLVGAPGSDLRLIELAAICAATLDTVPSYPVGG